MTATEGQVAADPTTYAKTPAPIEVKDMMGRWRGTCDANAKAHAQESRRLRRLYMALGIPATALGAIVGTAIFAAMEKAAQSPNVKWALAAVSLSGSGQVFGELVSKPAV